MRDLLLLCNRPAAGSNADTIIEHLDAIHRMPGFRVWEVSMVGTLPRWLDLDRFDAVGIHYSLHLSDPADYFLSVEAMDRLARFEGAKCIWVHDEYRNVDATIAKFAHIGIEMVFTVIPQQTAAKVYGRLPSARIITVLTGYVSAKLRGIRVDKSHPRPIDISYRARRTPYWLGALGHEKVSIGLDMLARGKAFGLAMDISVEEADRLYGEAWLTLLKSSRGSLCVESGASIIDFSGDIERRVNDFVKAHPGASFDDARPLFADQDGVDVINCVSPRIFEMAACRTLIVAYPGDYSGLIEPWIHYVPLAKDFSNLALVVEMLRHPQACNPILDRAYDDLIGSARFSYDAFSALCADHIAMRKPAGRRYSAALFNLHLHLSLSYLLRNYVADFLQRSVLASGLRRHMIATWQRLPAPVRAFLRPALRLAGR